MRGHVKRADRQATLAPCRGHGGSGFCQKAGLEAQGFVKKSTRGTCDFDCDVVPGPAPWPEPAARSPMKQSWPMRWTSSRRRLAAKPILRRSSRFSTRRPMAGQKYYSTLRGQRRYGSAAVSGPSFPRNPQPPYLAFIEGPSARPAAPLDAMSNFTMPSVDSVDIRALTAARPIRPTPPTRPLRGRLTPKVPPIYAVFRSCLRRPPHASTHRSFFGRKDRLVGDPRLIFARLAVIFLYKI